MRTPYILDIYLFGSSAAYTAAIDTTNFKLNTYKDVKNKWHKLLGMGVDSPLKSKD